MKPPRAQTLISLLTAALAGIGGLLLLLRRRAGARANPPPSLPGVPDLPASQPAPPATGETGAARGAALTGLTGLNGRMGAVRRPDRALLSVGALFFTAASALLVQPGVTGALFISCWLMALLLAGLLLLAPPPAVRPALGEIIARHAWELLPLFALVILAAWMQSSTPAPRAPLPEHERIIALSRLSAISDEAGVLFYAATLADLQRFSAALTVLGILGVYIFARRLGSAYVALSAAGFAAASGWTLALGKSGLAYPALTLFGALAGLALLSAWRTGSRQAYGWAGLAVGAGWLFTPLMLWLAPLIPLVALLSAVANRRAWRLLPARLLAALAMGAVVALPFASLPMRAVTDADSIPNAGLSRFAIFTDALASGLLQFGPMRDPNALHGLYDRPTLMPPLALLFALGLLVWTLESARQPRWEHALLPLMLLVSLFPAALGWHYPDALRSAAALPFVMALAGLGMQTLMTLLNARLGRASELFAALLLAALLLWTANDARLHYASVALPAAEQAAAAHLAQSSLMAR